MESTQKNVALVIETTNLLGGGATVERQIRTLERLLLHLAKQTYALAELRDLVITCQGVSSSAEQRLQHAAGRSISFVTLPPEADYYRAKNRGFDAAQGDVIVFADSDCWPDPDWLEQLVRPFQEPEVAVVAGRTTYPDDTFGRAASAVDFLYFTHPTDARATLNFYANNVAFRRSVLDEHRFPDEPEIYRGACQLLGLELYNAGINVRFQPAARTIHRFPDSKRELVALRLMRGRDLRSIAPRLVDTYAPRPLAIMKRAPRISASAAHTVRLLQGARRLRGDSIGAYAALVGISALDAVGSFAGGLGPRVLSYHR
jgi:GT2 family glycosyltransferase